MTKLENVQLVDPDRFGVPLVIPEHGTYALRVTAQGRDCYTCCNGPSCPSGEGEPSFEAVAIEFDRDDNPSTKNVSLKYKACE